ncbi:MAG: ArsR/SmtB family transcription factor [Blautia sp.]|jgi:DNA-binding transcriptional ArsR family regulator
MKQTEDDSNIELCCGNHPHHHIQHNIIPNNATLQALADLFKVFGDPTRIRILYALSAQELCVCDIAQILEMTQSAISHQLRVLKQMHLVKYRREGKTVFYSLADSHVYTILSQGIEHVEE